MIRKKLNYQNKIICAIDTNNLDDLKVITSLKGYVGYFKIGLNLFTAIGPYALKMACSFNAPIFLDLKLHDIPKTIYESVSNFSKNIDSYQTMDMLTLHASGGLEMIKAGVEASDELFDIIGITVLTSINGKQSKKVLDLVEISLNAGAKGIVCSANEVNIIRKQFGDDFKIIVPGISVSWCVNKDQKRSGHPKQIIDDGATYIVAGRAIMGQENKVEAAIKLIRELDNETHNRNNK